MSLKTKIFLSYRRDDSNPVIGRIYDRLVQAYGEDSVFKDVNTLPIGQDFRAHIYQHVGQCQALLAVIGPQWLTITDAGGNRRLNNPEDWVRIEIAIALKRSIPVVPLRVMDAKMPKATDLPDELKPLVSCNGLEVRYDPDFHNDMECLIGKLNLPTIETTSSNDIHNQLIEGQREALKAQIKAVSEELTYVTGAAYVRKEQELKILIQKLDDLG